jgi:hypothetical protein
MDTAVRLNGEAVALLERRLGPRHIALADALQSLGVSLYYSAKLEQAATVASRALEIHEAQQPPDPEALADDLSLLGSIEKQRRHLATAEAVFRREITLREPRWALIVKHNLVNVLLLAGRIAGGEGGSWTRPLRSRYRRGMLSWSRSTSLPWLAHRSSTWKQSLASARQSIASVSCPGSKATVAPSCSSVTVAASVIWGA